MRTTVAIALLLVFAPAPAFADQARERAQKLHEQGLAYYSTGEFDKAIEAYRQAYALVPVPGILFNLGQALRLAGDCAGARQVYKSYLREVPDADNAGVAREHLEAMEACLADRAAAAPPQGAAAASAGEPAGVMATAAPADPGRGRRALGLAAGGTGVALLGAGLVFGLKARSASREIDEFFAMGGTWTDELRAIEERGQRDSKIAIGLSAVGVAALVGGGLLYFTGRAAPAERGLALAPVERGAMLLWTGAY